MTKKPSPRNKAWEKDRRDRLNQTFNDLAKLLPKYDPKSPCSKIEILQKSISLIEELDKKLKVLNTDQATIDKLTELDGRLKVIKVRNVQLLKLLNGAGIAVPSFKSLILDIDDLNIPNIERLIDAENDEEVENLQPDTRRKSKRKLDPEKPKRKYTKRTKAVEKGSTEEPTDKVIPEAIVPQNPPAIKQIKRAPLLKIRTTGRKKKLTVKSDIYKVIQRHVLKCKRNRDIKSHRKAMKRKAKEANIIPPSPLPELSTVEPSKPDEIEKPLDINEILPNPLSNSDLSNDLFVSLHVPNVAPNAGSLSPTEAFLMSFPVVSGSVSVSAGKVNEQSQSEGNLRLNEPMNSIAMGLDNLFSPKEDFQLNYRSVGKQQPQTQSSNESVKVAAFQKEISNSYSLENIINGTENNQNNEIIHQQSKPAPEIQSTYSNNQLPLPVLDATFNIADKPTFNANNSTISSIPECPVDSMVTSIEQNQNHGKATPASNSQNQTDGLFVNRNPIQPDGNFSLSTDTKTTNSWSYNIKMNADKEQLSNLYYGTATGTEEASNYGHSQPFTFSLTKTTETMTKRANNSKYLGDQLQANSQSSGLFGYNSTATTQGTNSMIFDGYNPSFSLVPNTFLPPRPPPPVGVLPSTGSVLPDRHQFGSKPFSFQLTSVTETPAINSSKPNVVPTNSYNSFSIAATLDSSKGPVASKSKRQSHGENNSNQSSRNHEPGRKGSKSIADGARTREKQDQRKTTSGGETKKKVHSEEMSNKSHVNWMTDSTTNSQATDFTYPILQTTNLSMSYLPPPPSHSTTTIMGSMPPTGRSCRMDLNHKSDIFFAHPPEEDSFLWSKNTTTSCHPLDASAAVKYRHDDFNVSQLLPPPPPAFVPAPPPPTAPFIRQNAPQNKTSSVANQWRSNSGCSNAITSDYQPNGNCFSVSSLVVDSNKKCPPAKGVESLPPVIMNSVGNNNKWNNRATTSSSNNKIYSAESLIGNSSNSYGDVGHQIQGGNGAHKNTPSKRYPVGNMLNNVPDNLPHFNDLHPLMETELTDYNGGYNSSSQNQFGGSVNNRIEPKLSNSQMIAQDSTNSFPFYSNDFIQPLFTAPSLHLIPEGQPSVGVAGGATSSVSGQSSGKAISSNNKLNEYKRKYYEDDGRIDMSSQQVDFYPPPPPVPQPSTSSSLATRQPPLHSKKYTNYDISTSANFFPGHPPPPPPLIINHCSDTFSNYPNNTKISQSYVPPPIVDFNSNLANSTGTYSTNSLTNFNLSSICPEINSPIH